MKNSKDISAFYQNDVPSFAAYDNTRKLENYIDGLKLSQRKLLFTSFKKYPNDTIKTESFANIAATESAYLHGSSNLCGVLGTMAASYVGSNNFPLYDGKGGFGTRIDNTVSAPRYTKIALSKYAKILFDKDDMALLPGQFFEGEYIEPKNYVPILPIALLNGAEGLSTGFSQRILPRSLKDIVSYIKGYLNKEVISDNIKELLPYYKGFKGRFAYTEEGRLECYGVIEQDSQTQYHITELPIGMQYTSYIAVLDKLCENNTIQDYTDKCDPKTDTIEFIVKTTREFTKKYDTEYALLDVLRLIKGVTEQFNCIDENNRVREFSSAAEIMDAFITVRIKAYEDRKAYLLKTRKELIEKLYSKFLFFSGIIKGDIVVSNKSKDKIIAQIKDVPKIIEQDGSYDYLLNSPIHSISKETITKLKDQITTLKDEFNTIKNKTIKQFWLDDIDTVLKVLS